MNVLGWILLVIGAIINFLAKPVLQKVCHCAEDPEQKVLYVVKIIGLCLVIAGAMMIFIAGGKVDVGAVR